MSLSVIIPAKNEEFIIINTLYNLSENLKISISENFEIIVIDDFSSDNTFNLVNNIKNPNIKCISNKLPGVGNAVKCGIENSSKNYVCIYMADESDSINDLVNYYSIIKSENLDAVFGSRFLKTSKVEDYPFIKLVLNRIFNFIVRLFFYYGYNDYTNAFKIYKKDTLLKLMPLVSEKFNIFLELPLKIISRKFKFEIIPIDWKNRKLGLSKFDIKELGSHYIFTFLYCLLEKILLKK